MSGPVGDGRWAAEDLPLLERAGRDVQERDWRTLNVERLAAVSQERGIDYATALFYAALRQSCECGRAIRQIDDGVLRPIANPPALVLIPGAFHRHHDHTGADGVRVLAEAARLGWPAETLPVGSLDSVHANAATLIERLLKHDSTDIVLVSLSKGSADMAVATRHPRASQAFSRVRGWVSFSGMTHGTPLIEWLRRQRMRTIGVHLLLWAKGLRFAQLDELRRGAGAILDAPIHLPAHVRAIHVIGCCLRRHVRHRWASRGYDRLAPFGPNDGGGILLGDATRLPGVVYPVWGADHYLTPSWDFTPTLRTLLLHAAASQSAASPMPATKSTA